MQNSELFLGQSNESRDFMKHVRIFNTWMAMTSHVVDEITISEGIPGA